MAKRRKRKALPIMLLWSKGDQLRFSDAVEKLVSAVQDLVRVGLDLQALTSREKQRKAAASEAARKANATRKAAANGAGPADDVGPVGNQHP